MADFIEFKLKNGKRITVNKDLITDISEDYNDQTIIAFGAENAYIRLDCPYDTVVSAILIGDLSIREK